MNSAGHGESQDVSLYVLNNALSSINMKECHGPIELFLQNATIIRGESIYLSRSLYIYPIYVAYTFLYLFIFS